MKVVQLVKIIALLTVLLFTSATFYRIEGHIMAKDQTHDQQGLQTIIASHLHRFP